MTTGRINQVTTVIRSASPEQYGPAGVQTRPRLRTKWLGRQKPPVGRAHPEQRSRGPDNIQLPPLSFPRHGPQQDDIAIREEVDVACGIRASEGECQRLVTSRDGYGLRLTPECLRDNVRHRPTIHRLLRRPRTKSTGLQTLDAGDIKRFDHHQGRSVQQDLRRSLSSRPSAGDRSTREQHPTLTVRCERGPRPRVQF